MTVKFDNLLVHVGVPHKDFEIEATGNQDFLLFSIGHLSHGLLMAILNVRLGIFATKNPSWLLRKVFQKLFRELFFVHIEVLQNGLIFLGLFLSAPLDLRHAALAFLFQIPQTNLLVVAA